MANNCQNPSKMAIFGTKLLIKKIDHFFGKTAGHVSSPYSDEHLCAKAKNSLERLLRKAAE